MTMKYVAAACGMLLTAGGVYLAQADRPGWGWCLFFAFCLGCWACSEHQAGR